MTYPQRIVCLTEESVEILYRLHEEDRIIGVSAYACRPSRVKEKQVIGAFVGANIEKIVALNPDLIIGYSDIQKDIAKDLIERGQNVFISNHRSVNEILDYIRLISRIVGKEAEGEKLVDEIDQKIKKAQLFSNSLKKRPRIYIEEWDGPYITGIEWFSEIVELCGGVVVFREKSQAKAAKDRIVSTEDLRREEIDMVFACWCGKKVDISEIQSREFMKGKEFHKNNQIFDLDPAIFLQPGLAPFVDGINIIIQIIQNWHEKAYNY